MNKNNISINFFKNKIFICIIKQKTKIEITNIYYKNKKQKIYTNKYYIYNIINVIHNTTI